MEKQVQLINLHKFNQKKVMNKYLLVPTHIDALVLRNGISVAEAMVEFNRLPFFNGSRDVNPDIVNLSESIVSQPFQNQNLYLKSGIHLHWALPDTLTRETTNGEFPAVPNRWLVIREKGGKTEKSWVIESDYLYPADTGYVEDSVTYPYGNQDNSPPFRYLGRKLSLEDWKKEQRDNDEYLERLTAIGYGEATFAAFYPNCRSVFGFHDPDITTVEQSKDVEYKVIGWYSNSNQDYLTEFLEDFKQDFEADLKDNPPQKDQDEPPIVEYFITAVEEQLKWQFQVDDANGWKNETDEKEKRKKFIDAVKKDLNWSDDTFLEQAKSPQIICYSSLKFPTENDKTNENGKTNDTEGIDIKLAVGNTGIEALSAYLAETIDKSQKAIIEQQLEALQLTEDLDSQELDKGAKFEQLVHQNGFNAVGGGYLWKIRLETQQNNNVENQEENLSNQASQTKLDLPPEIAQLLDEVNQKQKQYDIELAKINSHRFQIFSDWYKYMVCTYPPEDTWDNYPDTDEVKYYLENNMLNPLQEKLKSLGKIELSQDDSGYYDIHVFDYKLLNPENKKYKIYEWIKVEDYNTIENLSTQLASSIKKIIEKINKHNQDLENKYQKLKEEYDKLTEEDKKTTSLPPLPPIFLLERVNSPRYWQPKEPVVLIVGDEVEATKRHGQDGIDNEKGLPECQIISIEKTIEDLVKENFQIIIDQNKPEDEQEKIGFTTWNKQPWNPFLLQWLVEIFPVENGNNKTSPDKNYSNNFLIDNYQLQTNDIDLSPQSEQTITPDISANRIKTDRDSNIYSGFSILTPYANLLLQKRIEEYLDKKIDLQSFYEAQKIPQKERKIKFLRQQINDLKLWYENQYKQNSNPVVLTSIQTYQELQKLHCLSQCLGGFNDALLMHKNTLQIEIDDPIGFEDYRKFTEEVRKAIENETGIAPQPLDDFSPIRTGEMRIIELRLIDTFGQICKLNWQENSQEIVIKPESMIVRKNKNEIDTEKQNRVMLPPRFVQPCQINFRLLSANHKDNFEMNDHPYTTPICGWILPNNLNGSLMIYDNQGSALGSINVNGEWDNAPGNKIIPTDIIDGKEIPKIDNIHLNKMVQKIITLGADFLKNFNSCLNNALNNIDPENFAQHQSIALLMGRAIAVVRASVSLELQGLPAINQDWNVFRQEMQNQTSLEARDTDKFVNVKIPIRIGEYKQFNDGIIGYWKEPSYILSFWYKFYRFKIISNQQINAQLFNGWIILLAYNCYENDIFYAPQSDNNDSLYIETQFDDETNNLGIFEEGAINIIQSIKSPPQYLTMLVDPRGKFHATSGVLPTKVIDIPPEHYNQALANIKVTFLTTPILTPQTNPQINQGSLNLPLPTAPDYDWYWLEKKRYLSENNNGEVNKKWATVFTIPMIEKRQFITAYEEKNPNSNREEVWQELIKQKWLVIDKNLQDNHQELKAIIIRDDKTKTNEEQKRPPLTGDLEGQDELIDQIFDINEISFNPVSSQATFTQSQEIREGWLVLDPKKS